MFPIRVASEIEATDSQRRRLRSKTAGSWGNSSDRKVLSKQTKKILILLFVWLAAMCFNAYAAQNDAKKRAWVTLRQLRADGLSMPLPIFPDVSPQTSKNVGVVEVELDYTGSVVNAKVVQSPGPEFTSSMLAAVRLWKFKSYKEKDVSLNVVVPFYFIVHEDGSRKVHNFWDSPYVGPQLSY